MMHVVAILETMWGEEAGDAPRWFKINALNHSGRRLYKLVGPDTFLLVTNSCRELVTSASQHGKPDPAWLAGNLAEMSKRRPIDVILVCGKVAQKTFAASGFDPCETRVIEMPHPAARMWTKELIAEIQEKVSA